MGAVPERFDKLMAEAEKLHHRNELAGTVGPDYFEPGMMEYLDQSDGVYDGASGTLRLRFEAKGTRYEGRPEQIERVKTGDPIEVVREETNAYNPNNFTLLTKKRKNVGNMPAELCNAIAPLYDDGLLEIADAHVSYVEPISKRSRHARQAILFVELLMRLKTE